MIHWNAKQGFSSILYLLGFKYISDTKWDIIANIINLIALKKKNTMVWFISARDGGGGLYGC